jgi:hypothetical protein
MGKPLVWIFILEGSLDWRRHVGDVCEAAPFLGAAWIPAL